MVIIKILVQQRWVSAITKIAGKLPSGYTDFVVKQGSLTLNTLRRMAIKKCTTPYPCTSFELAKETVKESPILLRHFNNNLTSCAEFFQLLWDLFLNNGMIEIL